MDNLQSVPIAQNIQESVDSLSGLTINDLNKYLPALQTAEDLSLEIDHLKEGVFWSEGLTGLQKVPSNSIDLSTDAEMDISEVLNLPSRIL